MKARLITREELDIIESEAVMSFELLFSFCDWSVVPIMARLKLIFGDRGILTKSGGFHFVGLKN